jgi:predicted MFS family arabinose efflux permease
MIISMARHDQRGTANSTLLVAWDVGIGLGVLAGGMVCEHLGYSSAFWMVAFVHALAVAMFFLATKAFFERRRLE